MAGPFAVQPPRSYTEEIFPSSGPGGLESLREHLLDVAAARLGGSGPDHFPIERVGQADRCPATPGRGSEERTSLQTLHVLATRDGLEEIEFERLP